MLSFPSKGTIRLRDGRMFADRNSDLCRTFLGRVFAIKEVQSVEIDPSRRQADIHCQEGFDSRQPAVLARLSRALQSPTCDPAAEKLHLGGDSRSTLRVHRHGTAVSTWELVHQLPGRVRLRHKQLLGRRQAARFFEQELATVFGVLGSKAAFRTGTLLIHYDDRAINTAQLLHVVEGILGAYDNFGERQARQHRADVAATSLTLALAAAGELAVPALLPVSAALLVLSNLGTLGSAWRELRSWKLGLSVLYVLIVAATIATGGFLTAALMSWLVHFWDRRSHRQLSHTQHQLLLEFRRRSRFAWVCRDDVEIGVAVEQLRPGDVVLVRSGEMIPADGVILDGQAEVDERLVAGMSGMTAKAPGDVVFASTFVSTGQVKIEIRQCGGSTRAASIVKAIELASTPKPERLQSHGKPFAERTVPPTLAAAGIGLAVGDLATALAILRPDYWSGPGISGTFGNLHDVVACAHVGVVVRDPAAFRRFSDCQVLLLDLQCAVDGHRAASASPENSAQVLLEMARGLRELRRGGSLQVGLVSEGRQRDVARCADFLGADFFESGLSRGAKAELIRDYGERGTRVAFVGDCRTHKQAARQAHLAVTTGDIAHLDDDPAHVFLLDWQLARLTELRSVAQGQHRRRRVHVGCTLWPNVACVAGALLLGFSSFHTVLISNLGVYTVYRSGTRWLRRLQTRQPTRTGGHAAQTWTAELRTEELSSHSNKELNHGTSVASALPLQ